MEVIPLRPSSTQVTTVDQEKAVFGTEPLEALHSFRSGSTLGWAESAGNLLITIRGLVQRHSVIPPSSAFTVICGAGQTRQMSALLGCFLARLQMFVCTIYIVLRHVCSATNTWPLLSVWNALQASSRGGMQVRRVSASFPAHR